MANPLALIRADASPSIGMGHRVRCQILADLLLSQGWQVQFVCHISCQEMSAESDRIIANESEFLTLALEANLVILDHYQYDSKMIEVLYNTQPRLFLIDDMNDRGALYCRWLLNPISLDYSANLANLINDYQETPNLFLGLDYALLRPQFRQNDNASLDKLLITLGGTDPLALTLPILKSLNSIGFRSADMLVMLGQNAKHADQVIRYCQQQNIEYHQGVKDVASLMRRAKMALSAGGSTLFELAAIGVPSSFFQVADNQTELLKEHEQQGWCRVNAINLCSDNQRQLVILQTCQQLLIDWYDLDYLQKTGLILSHMSVGAKAKQIGDHLSASFKPV